MCVCVCLEFWAKAHSKISIRHTLQCQTKTIENMCVALCGVCVLVSMRPFSTGPIIKIENKNTHRACIRAHLNAVARLDIDHITCWFVFVLFVWLLVLLRFLLKRMKVHTEKQLCWLQSTKISRVCVCVNRRTYLGRQQNGKICYLVWLRSQNLIKNIEVTNFASGVYFFLLDFELGFEFFFFFVKWEMPEPATFTLIIANSIFNNLTTAVIIWCEISLRRIVIRTLCWILVTISCGTIASNAQQDTFICKCTLCARFYIGASAANESRAQHSAACDMERNGLLRLFSI